MTYNERLAFTCSDKQILWQNLKGKHILITGATGLICSFLVDVLMTRNLQHGDDINIYAVGRDASRIKARFKDYLGDKCFSIIQQDVTQPFISAQRFDFIVHGASNAHPAVFSSDPVGTMLGNFMGVYHLLEHIRAYGSDCRFLYISSGEIYGQPSEDISGFSEDYSGYVDCTSPRACYPSSKRAAETLIASYCNQYHIDGVIARPCHIYGPTMTNSDSRASASFLRDVIAGKNIVMKSKGEQIRSYCYASDAVGALLTIMLKGVRGQAYNVSDKNGTVSILELAQKIAKLSGRQVEFELPDEAEKKGYTTVTRGVLDSSKLERLGWCAEVGLDQGISETLNIISSTGQFLN